MANPQKISELTTAGPLTGAELVPIVQNGGTLQTTVSALKAFSLGNVENEVSVLNIRVDAVSAVVDQQAEVVASLSAAVTDLTLRVVAVSAAVSVNAVQVAVVSALTSVNAAAITSVNAVVSTKANRNGDFLTNVQYIDFNTTTSYAVAPGRLTWDIESGTLDLGLTGTVNLLIGQRTVAQVYNNSGVTLPKGKAVRVTGAQGQRLTGALAQADSDAASLTIFGIMLETVSVNKSGYVATDGLVKNVNTLGYSDGDIVYLSPVSAGELTPIKPVAPQHLVQMGYIVNGGSGGAGEIYVKVQNGYELGELHDVKTSTSTSLADGEVLAYNVSAKVWTNSPALINAQASISALQVQLNAVSAAVSVNTAAITSVNNVVSALEIRVSSVSARASALDARITAVSASVSVLQIQVNNVSAALTSTNNVVSALEVRVSAVSAVGVANSAAITSVNNVVSVLEVRVSTVSAAVSVNTVAINAVSAAVSLRVLRAGDTMTGPLTITTSADQQGLTVAGRATFDSLVSISAGTYTGLQNYQDNTLQRAAFRDYALVLVARGSVSATATLDLTDGNFFQARAAGSTTFVFANPPVSVVGTGGAAGGFILELQNGGAATVTWPSTVRWPGGTAPTLTAAGFDVLVFVTDDGGTNWRGVQSMKDSK